MEYYSYINNANGKVMMMRGLERHSSQYSYETGLVPIQSLKAGDRIQYQSASGLVVATVKEITLGLNGEYKLIPWLLIEIESADGVPCRKTVTICGNDSYLKMMKCNLI